MPLYYVRVEAPAWASAHAEIEAESPEAALAEANRMLQDPNGPFDDWDYGPISFEEGHVTNLETGYDAEDPDEYHVWEVDADMLTEVR